jgi:hypothetical protein
MRISNVGVVSLASIAVTVSSFSVTHMQHRRRDSGVGSFFFEPSNREVSLCLSASVDSTRTVGGFIETELRGQAMKLHTRSQAPKEGQAAEKKREPYVPTQINYLAFLVDSQHIYKALEEIVSERDELSVFRKNGMERVEPLETDIEFMMKEYNLERPEVGKPGLDYAEEMRRLGKEGAIPELICHYYNFYFAHTAGGRMIGKKMSALLLDKKTLEFYKVCVKMWTKCKERRVIVLILCF